METVDTRLLNGRIRLAQPKQGGLRATMDSVFVAAACPARAGDRVLDLGAGTGAVGLCVASRVPGVTLGFVEIQPHYAEIALRNAGENGIVAESLCADIRTVRANPAYDHVVINPPYRDEAAHDASPDEARRKAVGRGGDEAVLGDWIACAARCLSHKGSVSIIHRADALSEILVLLEKNRFGAAEIWPLHPYADKPAHRVVVRAVKNRRTKLVLHPAMILHTSGPEKYSPAGTRVMSDGAALA